MDSRGGTARRSLTLTAADLYQVVETSDIPAGMLNIVTGEDAALLLALAKHDDVDAFWCFGSAADSALVERASVGNLKRTFVDHGRQFDWFDRSSEGPVWLCQAVQLKNIWIPYGDCPSGCGRAAGRSNMEETLC